MWPGMLSLCAKKYPGAGASMFALLAVGGDIGCSLGPWLTGVAADMAGNSPAVQKIGAAFSLSAEQTGLRAGILAGVFFPLFMIIGMAVLSRHEPKNFEIR